MQSFISGVRALALAAALATAVGACAPDSVRSAQAVGFNGYLNTIGQLCQPMLIGQYDVGEWIRMNTMGNDNYDYFVDVTSKLYYNRLTPAGYRQAVVGFFGSGSGNERAFDCIIRNLPPDRPNAPVGTY